MRMGTMDRGLTVFIPKIGVNNAHSYFQVRTKLAVNRASPAPGAATQKADAANQTKPQAVSPASQVQQMAATK
jgi:hypothetical protein